jgi:hypothetical protein
MEPNLVFKTIKLLEFELFSMLPHRISMFNTRISRFRSSRIELKLTLGKNYYLKQKCLKENKQPTLNLLILVLTF